MLKLRGGAVIGWANASAPMVSLESEARTLTLRVLVFGTYQFRPDQIVELQEYRGTFGLTQGIRIIHVHSDYPERIVFLGGGAISEAISEIQRSGFIPSGVAPVEKHKRSFPYRWPVFILGMLIWNGSFLIDRWRAGVNPFDFRTIRHGPPVGPFAVLGIGIVLLFLAGVRLIPSSRWLLLKPGRSFEEVKHWVNLILLILSFMLPMMLLFRHVLWKEGI